jgi:hypothetical protein
MYFSFSIAKKKSTKRKVLFREIRDAATFKYAQGRFVSRGNAEIAARSKKKSADRTTRILLKFFQHSLTRGANKNFPPNGLIKLKFRIFFKNL